MTMLPIDYSKRPWRTKYLDEETPVLNRWFIFGTFEDGTVSICDGTNDIFDRVPLLEAQEICDARNEFSHKIVEIVNRGTDFDPKGRDLTELRQYYRAKVSRLREELKKAETQYTIVDAMHFSQHYSMGPRTFSASLSQMSEESSRVSFQKAKENMSEFVQKVRSATRYQMEGKHTKFPRGRFR